MRSAPRKEVWFSVKLECARWAWARSARRQDAGTAILAAVEKVGVGVLVGLLGGSIGNGVLQAAGLAEFGGAHGMQGVDEEGARGSGQDEAAWKTC